MVTRDAPFVLVGLKSDLRDEYEKDPSKCQVGESPIPTSKGNAVAESLKAASYIECSALKQYNLNEVFQVAIRTAIHPPVTSTETKPSEGGCCGIL